MADKGFPATVLLGFCVPCQKRTLKLLSKIPPCVQKTLRQCGTEVIYFKCRGDKSQTQEIDQKKKKKNRNQNQEERKADKGANKETARKLAGNFGSGGTEDGKESRSDEKLGYRKCMQLWGKEPGTVS